ncbi:hypothetical protein FQZ97_878670 [compost metagenome]
MRWAHTVVFRRNRPCARRCKSAWSLPWPMLRAWCSARWMRWLSSSPSSPGSTIHFAGWWNTRPHAACCPVPPLHSAGPAPSPLRPRASSWRRPSPGWTVQPRSTPCSRRKTSHASSATRSPASSRCVQRRRLRCARWRRARSTRPGCTTSAWRASRGCCSPVLRRSSASVAGST